MIIKLRQLFNRKLLGFTLCIGDTCEFEMICQEISTQNCFPNFITVDYVEGVTGAAPLEFAGGVGIPFEPALIFVNKTVVRFGIRDKIRILVVDKLYQDNRFHEQ